MPAQSDSLPHDDLNPSAVHGRPKRVGEDHRAPRSVMSSSAPAAHRNAPGRF